MIAPVLHRVDGVVGVEVGLVPNLGWTAYRDGLRLPRGRKRYTLRTDDGRKTTRSLHSLVWHAGPGPGRAWDYRGLPIPGLSSYRLDGEPGAWELRTYARHSALMPGAQVAQIAHPEDGRPVVQIVADWGEKLTYQLSRVVLIAHQGWPPSLEENVCRHLDGDWENDHPENLAWGTDADNAQDRQAHGRTRGITPGGRKPELEDEAA